MSAREFGRWDADHIEVCARAAPGDSCGCEAYIASQTGEGWSVLPGQYNDGGYSGGNIERPGLEQLLADIETGKIDIVVVYKIDRLTRSLTDFARIVEVFERAQVSFVSVTQSFNTTDSMGRLMLNVLLSFAQFEREVTGERIRDKIAALKAKGMWMGGLPPLGYDPPDDDSRILKVSDQEAETVQYIFKRYLELGSVHALCRALIDERITSKLWITQKGKTMGGKPFSRGALFHLLRNPIYCGKIRHKGEIHEGGHDAIVSAELFEQVQASLDGNAQRLATRSRRKVVKSPLVGKLFDATGEPMSPTTSRGKCGKTYRYYVSSSLQKGANATQRDYLQRISAPAIEEVVAGAVSRWLKTDNWRAAIRSVQMSSEGIQIALNLKERNAIRANLSEDEEILSSSNDEAVVLLPTIFPTRGGQKLIVPSKHRKPKPDPILIAALRKAHTMLEFRRGLPVVTSPPASPHDRKILRLAFLAPDIQRAILEGRQPPSLNLEFLKKKTLPVSWSQQRELLGFSI